MGPAGCSLVASRYTNATNTEAYRGQATTTSKSTSGRRSGTKFHTAMGTSPITDSKAAAPGKTRALIVATPNK